MEKGVEKIITEEVFSEIEQEVIRFVENRNECLRYGQSVYNEFYRKVGGYEPSIETFSDFEADCFFLDQKVPIFIDALRKEMVGKKYIVKNGKS